MNAVIVDGDVPYPPTSGKRLRTYHLMTRLARRGHQITYLSRGRGEEARQATEHLATCGIAAIMVDDPLPPKTGWTIYGRLAANLLSALPYSVAAHDSRPMRKQLQALADRQHVDLWQCEWTPYADLLPASARSCTLVNAHNVDSLIWERYYASEANPLRRWYIKQQWHKFQQYEGRSLRRATRVVACSAEDATIIRTAFNMERVDVVENGIDRNYFEAVRPCPQADHILFLGSLEYLPNLDAVRLLLDRVFPAVRAIRPAAQLVIVGRNPPLWLVRATRNRPNVELHANVSDVRPYLARSAVLAVPLRSGGGSRLKILEALACGLPVVSTRVGAEGLHLTPGRDLVVVDRVEDMGAEMVRCLTHSESARAMAERGRRLVLQNYDWDELSAKLEQVWEKCRGNRENQPVTQVPRACERAR